MAENKDDFLTSEVEKRLEDLFGDSESSDLLGSSVDLDASIEAPIPGGEERGGQVLDSGKSEVVKETSPIEELKSIVLSIDWEINDEIMNRFTGQVNKLQKAYKADKFVLPFLQLLESLGGYIQANKVNSHPDATKVLNSVYKGLEKIVVSNEIPIADRKKLVVQAVNKFKKLQQQIAETKAGTARKKEVPKPRAATQKVSPPPVEPAQKQEKKAGPPENLAEATAEIKQLIQEEFRKLKTELKLWLENQ